jgi:hypothetical protein
MAFQKVTRAIGGITPLGEFTITPGTPQNILANTGITTARYAFQCRQIGFSVSSLVAGEVYVNYGNIAGLGNQTALIVQSSQCQSLPIGMRSTDGLIDVTQWWLDGSAACKVAVYALDGTTS